METVSSTVFVPFSKTKLEAGPYVASTLYHPCQGVF